MKVLSGSNIQDLTARELYEQIGPRSPVVIDVGTGIGRYVLAGASADPNSFFIGIDPVTSLRIAFLSERLSSRAGIFCSSILVFV